MPEPHGARLSRRAALGAGAAAAAAAALAPAAAAQSAEGAALTALVRSEGDAAFAYREAGLEELAEQERAHARALAAHLEALTLPIPAPRRGPAGLGARALAVLDAGTARELRRAAVALERSLMAGCERRLGVLVNPNTVRTVATVLASHAQHRLFHELSDRR